jgi:hypothetical protein
MYIFYDTPAGSEVNFEGGGSCRRGLSGRGGEFCWKILRKKFEEIAKVRESVADEVGEGRRVTAENDGAVRPGKVSP